jgi:acetyl esterase/lipase
MRGAVEEFVTEGPRWARDAQRRVAFPFQIPGVVVEPRAKQLGGLLMRHIEKEGPTIFYCHGGGYVVGAPETYRNLVGVLLSHGGRAVLPAYRLAPEHPYPSGLDDIERAYDLLREHTSAERIIIAGDSAGGGLCLGLLHRLKERGETMPAGAYLISPWTNPFALGGSIDRNQQSDVLANDFGRWCARQVFGGMAERNPEAAAVRSNPAGYPPLLIQDGGAEMLADQIDEFVQLARNEGVFVEHDRAPDMFHVYQMWLGLIGEAGRAVKDARRWCHERIADAERLSEV